MSATTLLDPARCHPAHASSAGSSAIKISAPGKLILSGEHAVVHGYPALAMAIDRYVTATATPEASSQHVSFHLSDLSYRNQLNLVTLEDLKERIKRNYQKFISGDFTIREVLQKPFELAQVAFGLFFEMLNIKLTHGINIHVASNIPIGCGMGSSAATVMSVMHAIANHLQIEMSPETFLQLGREAENMQHGYSSGLDLQMSLHGGCVYVEQGKTYLREIPKLPLYLVHTGAPVTSTGECVEFTTKYFQSSMIGDDFAKVTQVLDVALQNNHLEAAMQAVRENHALLVKIGVVPARVQQFISKIEVHQGAAKICGAGAISGDNAGMVMVFTQDETQLRDLCQQYDYSLLPIAGESRGVHFV